MTKKPKRRIDFDFIRIFACLTILMNHFNGSVSGFDYSGQFLFQNGIVPNIYFGCVYLGEIGNSLFFILSGASLMLKRGNEETRNPFRFWFKRAKALYPAFWIAFIGATCVHFLHYKWISTAPFQTVLWSMFGMDGYAMCRGWSTGAFYQVGEWYLGCILLCYLFWPLIMWLWEKLPPIVFGGGAIAVYIAVVQISNGNDKLVLVRLCEMIAGGCFSRYIATTKNWKLLGGSFFVALICVGGQSILHLHFITVSFAVCWAIFVGCSWLVECLPAVFSALAPCLKTAAGLTYPLFLVHHKLISILVTSLNLEYFPYRYTIVLFVIYLAMAFFLAYWLDKTTREAMHTVERVCNFVQMIHSSGKGEHRSDTS